MQGQESEAAELANCISGTLRLARALVQAGRRVDLEGLEAEVGKLCGICLDLPPEQGRGLRASMMGVLADLDALAATIGDMAP